jgi:hypothetical protein
MNQAHRDQTDARIDAEGGDKASLQLLHKINLLSSTLMAPQRSLIRFFMLLTLLDALISSVSLSLA